MTNKVKQKQQPNIALNDQPLKKIKEDHNHKSQDRVSQRQISKSNKEKKHCSTGDGNTSKGYHSYFEVNTTFNVRGYSSREKFVPVSKFFSWKIVEGANALV